MQGLESIKFMHFRIVGTLTSIETFAGGGSIRELERLKRHYGKGRWRKRKDECYVRLSDGTVRLAELHWYEASGIGKKECKVKRYLD